MANEPTTTTKPWWKSKIILLALASALLFGGNALTGFLTGNGVTPEQLDAIKQTQPAIADSVDQLQHGGNVIQVILGAIVPALIFIARKWFTNIPLLR